MLSGYTAVQVLVQGVAFASGVLLVRVMEQSDYGHYTLAISMVGLANVLLDLGLATAVLAIGGPEHWNRKRLASLLGDAFRVQRTLLLGLLLLVPIFAFMLHRQGLQPVQVFGLVLLVLACAVFNVHNAILVSVVRLRGDLALQQKLEIGVALGKLLLIIAATAVYLDAQVAVGLNLLAAGALFGMLRSRLTAQLGATARSIGTDVLALKSFIRRQAPNTLYYCFMGQITIWLIGILGNADRLAEIGALGRLAAVFTVIGAVVGAVIQPYFARQSLPRDLVSAFFTLNAFFTALTVALVALAVLAPQALLWILGARYSGLTVEVVWMVLAASLSAWSGAAYAVGASRGWLVSAWVQIPFGLCAIAVSCWAFDVSSVAGCFMLNTSVAAVSLALTLWMVTKHLLIATRSGETAA